MNKKCETSNEQLIRYEQSLHRIGYQLIAVGALFVFAACVLVAIVVASLLH